MRRLSGWWLIPCVPAILIAYGCGTSSTAPSPPSTAPPPAPTAVVLRTATFQSANGYTTTGRALILRDGDAYTLDLQDDFRTSNGGSLEVRLCRDSACTATDLNLGAIQSRTGRQVYALSDAAASHRYVVIYCRIIRAPFGFGLLQ